MENPKCDVCNTITDNSIISSCLHRYCYDCFYKIGIFNKDLILNIDWNSSEESKKELNLKCLMCSTGILNMAKNEINKKLISILTEGKKSKWEMCRLHNKEMSVYCIQCKILMCLECFNYHKVMPVFSSHQLEENPSQYLSFPSKSCRVHDNQSLKYYCNHCNLHICQTCKTTEHDSHNYQCIKDYFILKKKEINSRFFHPFLTFDEISKKLEEFDSEMKRKMKRQVTELKDRIHSLSSLLKEFMIEIDEKVESIENESEIYAKISKVFFKKFFEDLECVSNSDDYDYGFEYLDKISKYVRLERVEIEVDKNLKIYLKSLEEILEEMKIMQKSCFYFEKIPEEFKNIRNLKDHKNEVNKLIELKDGKFASASSDKKIIIWDPYSDFKFTHLLEKHSKNVKDVIELKDGNLVSCSMDATIVIWNFQDNKYIPIHTIHGYSQTFNCLLELEDGRIASGSYDFSIKIFDPKLNYKCVETLNGHYNYIRCMIQLKDGRMVSCSDDKSIKIWKVKTNLECILTLNNSFSTVNYLLQLKDGRMASCSAEGTKIWNVDDKFTCVKYIENNSSILCMIQLKDGRIAAGTSDNIIKIWDIENFNCTNKLSGHSDSVKSLIELEDGRLVSGSRDYSIKIWK